MTAPAEDRCVTVFVEDVIVASLKGEQTVTTPTPVPPFGLRPLASRFVTVHAAAVAHPVVADSAVLIHGPSTVGKSSLAFELIRRGWMFLSDDTSPIDRENRVHPFTRPVGIRERAAASSGVLLDSFTNARHHETPWGRTVSVHPRELGWSIAPPSRVRWLVSLSHGVKFETEADSGGVLRVALDIDRDKGRAADAIEAFCSAGRSGC
ncbi:hypothetical protein [Microbacterium hominis]|uniref:hypothetical protein n=1 Tax=Microbacterium hominis TaxID=162426 RepID=UPI0014304AF8|nr:hypothetical protein [Microbacterium hominis]